LFFFRHCDPPTLLKAAIRKCVFYRLHHTALRILFLQNTIPYINLYVESRRLVSRTAEGKRPAQPRGGEDQHIQASSIGSGRSSRFRGSSASPSASRVSYLESYNIVRRYALN
jgi:hypothetical protein